MARLRQFGLLLWKNYVLQKRQVLVTLVELALPALFAAILIAIRQRVPESSHPNATIYSPLSLSRLPDSLMWLHHRQFPEFRDKGWFLAFTPANVTAVHDIAERVHRAASGTLAALPFDSEAELLAFIKADNRSAENVLAAMVFENRFARADDPLPEKVTYSLRFKYSPRNAPLDEQSQLNPNRDNDWITIFLFPLFQLPGPRERHMKDGGTPGYYREGFLATQRFIDEAITAAAAERLGSAAPRTAVEVQRFPYPPYRDDIFILAIQTQLPLLLMLSFVYTALNIVRTLVHEKESKLKEYMKMMCLSNWLHWTAWFLKFFIFFLISVFYMTVLFCVKVGERGAVLNFSDPTLVFVFILAFSVSTISFCFMISVFFSQANVAATAGAFLYFFSYIPYFFVLPWYDQMSHALKMSSCLISNVGMAMGAQLISMWEGKGVGIQWRNLGESVSVDDGFTMAHVLFMLMLDAVLYGLVAWYVEAVFPGEYGVPQPWYFCVLPSYWRGTQRTYHVSAGDGEGEGDGEGPASEFIEREPLGLATGVKIQGLRKVFGKGRHEKEAVKGLTLNMYEGQITALLGHNGAGKTTTLSILTGLFPPSGGTALVNGYDIRYDMTLVRKSLGLCPQHDVLFPDLTVEEHLSFFAKLKGCPYERVPDEVSAMLTALQLEDKRQARASALSGGMKRKLSIGIAFIGDPKVVLLDEPTSGMDPCARRATWELLQRQRAGRTVLLSTHFMEEADVLGDRVAIVAHGRLQCCGSSLFLKRKYGAGYHMVVVKQPEADVAWISKLVHSHVPEANLSSNAGAELAYIMPADTSHRFEGLFTELERRRDELGINSYGVSVTTMEEVFLRVGKLADSALDAQARQLPHLHYQHERRMHDLTAETDSISASMDDTSTLVSEDLSSIKLNTGMWLLLQQCRAMFLKRAVYCWRNWKVMVAQFLVPLIFTTVALVVARTLPGPRDSPSLDLSLARYGAHVSVPYALAPGAGPEAASVALEYRRQIEEMRTATAVFVNDDAKYPGGDILDYLVDNAKAEGGSFNTHCVVGAAVAGGGGNGSGSVMVTALFNGQGFHTPATALLLVDNALLRHAVGANHSISVRNYPLPRNITERAMDQFHEGQTGFAVAFNLMYGLASLASTFALLLVTERATRAKHIQLVSGVRAVSYWVTALLWDLFNYMIPCCCILLVFLGFEVKAYTAGAHLLLVLLILLLYGWAVIPLMYLLQNFFSSSATAYTRLSMFNVLSGTASFLSVNILRIPELGLLHLCHTLDKVFLMLPNYCLGQSLNYFYENYQFIQICNSSILAQILCRKNNITYQLDYLAWQPYGVGRYLTLMAVQGAAYLLLVFLLELNAFRSLARLCRNLCHRHPWWRARVAQVPVQETKEDEDVARERLRVANVSAAVLSEQLVVKDLRKVYGVKNPLVAVDGISVGIPAGECFGLLGFNGAGKTTTFKMLTGEETATSGDAVIGGYSILTDIRKVQQRIGYCPQFDGLLEHMTGRETLWMYARLRGVPERLIPAMVDDALRALLVEAYADKLVRTYSGGTKRKLSTAVALMGSPPVVFLDEPSTGMDPVARRLLWDALSRVREEGRALVITSHSMEECEALCTRIAIMVNGQFRCLGSQQHLKSRYGSGYTLLARIRAEQADTQPFKHFVETTFPGSILKDQHQGLVHYHLTDMNMSWAQVFGMLEKAKRDYCLDDYSISQISLEQVFLGFARFQRHTEERPE
uniref:ABCA3 n=1 Tax=Petromyzon marinus TaxID=7757 RepID=A0A0G2ST91_PETMA|nr:ABCA3 [Petromyzon marinus]